MEENLDLGWSWGVTGMGPCHDQCWLGMAAKICSLWAGKKEGRTENREPCPKARKTKPKSMLGPSGLLLDGFLQTGVWGEGAVLVTGCSTHRGLGGGRTPKRWLRMGARADGHWDVPRLPSGCQAIRDGNPLEAARGASRLCGMGHGGMAGNSGGCAGCRCKRQRVKVWSNRGVIK